MRLFLLTLLAAGQLAAADSFLGSWELNIPQSEFSPKNVRYQRHTLTWQIVGKQLHYREEGSYGDGRQFGISSQFTATPNGPPVKPVGETTYGHASERISLQVFGDDMLWISTIGKTGKIVARWLITLKDGSDQLVISQITGGSGTRVFDRVK
jgi:hypothetical protein